MPRKATATPEFKESLVDPAQVSEGSRALDVQNQVMSEQETRTFELARQLGHEGALTVGGLEDEIRFYQQQTVDNWIAVGKRLLLLKDMTPHGEFEKRRALLGFSSQSCSRFISSAIKIRKSPKLGDLAERTKNMSAFMELITLDDGVIDSLAELDEFDKMSPSQLRAAARKLRDDHEDALKQSSKKSDKIDELELKLDKKEVAPTDWPAAFTVLFDQAAAAQRKLTKAIHELSVLSVAANQVQPANAHEEAGLEEAQRHLAEEMKPTFDKGLKDLYEAAMLFGNTLGARADSVVFPA